MFTFLFFFFNDTATTEIYTLSLHDALPISAPAPPASSLRSCARASRKCLESIRRGPSPVCRLRPRCFFPATDSDRKSTRLNSSHSQISYAVFCLKKKKNNTNHRNRDEPVN